MLTRKSIMFLNATIRTLTIYDVFLDKDARTKSYYVLDEIEMRT